MAERIAGRSVESLQTDRHNLPAQLTTLIGREQEVGTVRALLQRPEIRLVTLTRTGGVGKTRLGLQVATEVLDTFPDGVFLVSLAPITDPELVVTTIAESLGIREISGRILLDLLKAYLHEKCLMLLLDNFEQVLAAAVQVTDLLSACPQLKVLVTSRAPLHVGGEQEYDFPPLAVPDPKHLPDLEMLSRYEAVALFLQRAKSVKPEFRLNDANARPIAEICCRLDGLPLAIELAAVRIKMLQPPALLARLEHRLEVLTQGPRDVHARQQTLRNTIQWSYDLLSEQEQLLFRRLAVFVGGCTVEAAEALYTTLDGESIHVFDGITSLIDKSLLWQGEQEAEEPHFMMLETIREYGLELLKASGEDQLTRQAHAQYYLALVEVAEPQLHGPEQARWFDRLEQERNNLRASLHWLLQRAENRERIEMALRLGAALYWFWFVRGPVNEGWTELSQALARSKGVAVAVRAKALWAAGWLAGLSNDHVQAEALCQESLSLFRQIGDTAGVAMASLFLGIAELWMSQLAVARTCFEESLALFRKLEDKENIGWSLYHLAAVALFQGEYTRAYLLFEESLALFRVLGNTAAVTIALYYLGQALFFQGDVAKAQVVLEEGLVLSKQIGHKQWAAVESDSLGQVFLYQGNFALARSAFEEGLARWRQLGNREAIAFSLSLLARAEAGQGNHATARVLYEESLALYRAEVFSTWENASYLEGLAAVVVLEGESAWAARLWGAAEALRETSRAPLPAVYRSEFDRAVAAARVQLGEQSFATAWAEGHSMTPEQALAARGSVTISEPVHTKQSSTPPAEKLSPTYPDGLTAREVEVLRFIAQGLTDAHIAEQLVISPRTVNTHLTSIYSKIQVSSRSGATRYAIDHHLV